MPRRETLQITQKKLCDLAYSASSFKVNTMTILIGWCLFAYGMWQLKKYLHKHPDQAEGLRTSVRNLLSK
jgi:hypothetical protein